MFKENKQNTQTKTKKLQQKLTKQTNFKKPQEKHRAQEY